MIVAEDGSLSSASGTDFIGYETSLVVSRVCMPSSAVLSDAFSDVVSSLSSSMKTGSFSSITSDIENVLIYSILELAMVIMCGGFFSCGFFDFYVLIEMLGRNHGLGIDYWNNCHTFRLRSHLLVQWWKN